MKTVTMYETADGTLHRNQATALSRDQLILAVKKAMLPLERPDYGNGYSNGQGYHQHFPEKVATVKRALIELTRPYLKSWMQKAEERGEDLMKAHPSWFGRLLDGGTPPLERAWGRMMCITADGKEYGQPFYAMNPEKAEGGRLNN